jgi:hypothetical protein
MFAILAIACLTRYCIRYEQRLNQILSIVDSQITGDDTAVTCVQPLQAVLYKIDPVRQFSVIRK